MRRLATALISLPLALIGVLVAHQAGYFVVTDAHDRAAVLADTGHGYLSAAPLAIALLSVLLALGLLVGSVAQWRGARGRLTASAWPFAVLGPVAFTLQEHVERLVHDGAFPWTASLEPTFILGLLFQLPIALIALGIARRLLRATRRIVGAIARTLRAYQPAAPGCPAAAAPSTDLPHPSGPVLLSAAAGRAPPEVLLTTH